MKMTDALDAISGLNFGVVVVKQTNTFCLHTGSEPDGHAAFFEQLEAPPSECDHTDSS